MTRSPLRAALAAVLLAAGLYAGARPLGRAPAVGPFLEPARGVWALARTDRPPRDAAIPGLGADVRVIYDSRDVPHIFASTETDAYRALGYVTARDRLFQLYLQTLAASGRLTEIGGAAMLDADREMRRLGLTRAAERQLAAIDTTRASWRLLQAYGDGINAYVAHMPPGDLPFEFRLLGVRPPRWQPINSIELFDRMGWTLAYIAPEVSRARAAARVGAAAAASLFPEADPIQEPIVPEGRRAPSRDFAKLAPPGAPDSALRIVAAVLDSAMPFHLARHALTDADGERSWLASNNWAVSPARSATGHALLEGDPHLGLTLPSVWYEAHLVVPGKLDVYGVTLPGLPGVIIGFNRDIAWTFTNTGADVLDLYRERVDDDAHPTRYLLDSAWRPLERRIERYRGRHGETIATDTLYFTHRGPMRRDGGEWLSMRWTVLEAPDEVPCFARVAHAASVVDFARTMDACYAAPAQNMLLADRAGQIAIRSTGRFPIRPGDGSGLEVRDGTTTASDWRGYLPPDEYPQALDPAQGYLASANQQPVDPRTTRRYEGGSYDPWRALHINQLLRGDSAVTVDDMRRFETDPGSARADWFVPYFLDAAARVERRGSSGATTDRATLHEAARLLAQWDRRYTMDNTRAVLFEAAMRELADRTWDELLVGGRRVATPPTSVLAELLADSTNAWWDDRRTPRVEDRDDILAASLVAALDDTRRRYGEPDAGGWTWRRVRHENVFHLLHIPALSALGLPVQGGPETLSPSAGAGVDGASWRMVVELGPELRGWGTYPGGQSGNPASVHYADRIPLWVAGRLEPLLFPRTPRDLGRQTSAAFTLSPARR